MVNPMDEYYTHVAAQTERNPSTKNLKVFLANKTGEQSPCSLVALEFFPEVAVPEVHGVEVSSLTAYLKPSWTKDSHRPLGRILVVEDPTGPVMETLGSQLHVDPLFFASHLHTPWPEISTQTPELAMLPSRVRPDKYVNIHYHRTIVFNDNNLPPRQFLRVSNVHRKVVILPKTKNTCLGFSQHCCSIFKTVLLDKSWMCIVLTDPPITGEYHPVKGRRKERRRVHLPSSLFLGGYEDFLDPPPMELGSLSFSGPSRHCLREDLIHYWRKQRPEGFDAKLPSLLHLANYPMRIVAAEWVNYLTVMHHSIKQYEYTVEDLPSLVEELDRLNEDLRSLQSWRRRTMSSEQKMRSVARFIRFSPSTRSLEQSSEGISWQELLVQDYDHLARSVDDFGQRFERMMPVVTSMVQIADSRRSFAETKNVSRLTYLALVFVPLTFTTGLFSMDSEIAPGAPKFWIYFAVSIPITTFVFMAARPPTKLRGLAKEYWRAFTKPKERIRELELNSFTESGQEIELPEMARTMEMGRGYSVLDRWRGRGREGTVSTF